MALGKAKQITFINFNELRRRRRAADVKLPDTALPRFMPLHAYESITRLHIQAIENRTCNYKGRNDQFYRHAFLN